MPLDFTSSLDASGFSRGCREIERESERASSKVEGAWGGISDSLKGGIAGIAASLSIGAIASAVSGLVDFAGEIQDAADAAGLTTEQFQGLIGVFEQSGISSEKTAKLFSSLTDSIQQARDGNEGTIESFERLGVSWDEIHQNSPYDILMEISDGLQNATDKTRAAAAAGELLGKGQAAIIAALAAGSEEIKKQADEVDKMSARQIAALDKTGDAWTKFVRFVKTRGATATAEMIDFAEREYEAIKIQLERGFSGKGFGPIPDSARKARNFEEEFPPKPAPGEVPASPQQKKALEKIAKERTKGEKERAELAEKTAQKELKLAQDIADAEYDRIQKARDFYVDGLEGEEKLKELEEDRLDIVRMLNQADIENIKGLTDKLGLKEREIAQEERLQKEKAKSAAVSERMAKIDELKNQGNRIVDSFTEHGLSGSDARRQNYRDMKDREREQERTDRLLRKGNDGARAFQRELSGGGIRQVLINEQQVKQLVAAIHNIVNVN